VDTAAREHGCQKTTTVFTGRVGYTGRACVWSCFGDVTHTVPSAPRALQLTQTQEDPPVIAVTWQPPRSAHGRLDGYKLTYGIRADSYVEERRFDADKHRFTTGFLGQLLPNFNADRSCAIFVLYSDVKLKYSTRPKSIDRPLTVLADLSSIRCVDLVALAFDLLTLKRQCELYRQWKSRSTRIKLRSLFHS